MTPTGGLQEITLFDQAGPIPVLDQETKCFIWSHPSMQSLRSGLKAVPDIVITSSSDGVTASNIISIIECKCRETLGASDIRGEFGKAYDLGSPSYVLVSYYSVPESLIEAGRKLGIDIQIFSLNTSERDRFMRRPQDVGEDMAIKLSSALRRRMFLTAIENRAADIQRKRR
jgi:hypothetical protein